MNRYIINDINVSVFENDVLFHNVEYQLKFYFSQIKNIEINDGKVVIEFEDTINYNEVTKVAKSIVDKFSRLSNINIDKVLYSDKENINRLNELDETIENVKEKFNKISAIFLKKVTTNSHTAKIIPSKLLPPGLNYYNANDAFLIKCIDEFLKECFETIFKAENILIPSMIKKEIVAKAGYFDTGCQHLSFISPLVKEENGLMEFQKKYKQCILDTTIFNYTEKPKYILNPAICLHFYPLFKEMDLDNDIIVTSSGSCFRDESGNLNNIERLYEFKMREIVICTKEENIKSFQKRLLALMVLIGNFFCVDFKLKTSNDMFFLDNADKQLFSQLVTDDKIELECFCKSINKYISVGSVNKHHLHFSKPFNLINSNSEFLNTMCLGFGINRLLAILKSSELLNSKKEE